MPNPIQKHLNKAHWLWDLITTGSKNAALLFALREWKRNLYQKHDWDRLVHLLIAQGASVNAKNPLVWRGCNATDLALGIDEKVALHCLEQGGVPTYAGIVHLGQICTRFIECYAPDEFISTQLADIISICAERAPSSDAWHHIASDERTHYRYSIAGKINLLMPGFLNRLEDAKRLAGAQTRWQSRSNFSNHNLHQCLVRTVDLKEIDCEDPITRSDMMLRIPDLIKQGANPNTLIDGRRAMGVAIRQLDEEVVDLLLAYGTRASAFDLIELINQQSMRFAHPCDVSILISEADRRTLTRIIEKTYPLDFDWDQMIEVEDWEGDPMEIPISQAFQHYMDDIRSIQTSNLLYSATPHSTATTTHRRL